MKKDKLQHFLTGLGISIITLLAGFGLIGSCAACYIWAITKEILDKVSGKGECDPYDWIWTLNGWFFMVVLILLARIILLEYPATTLAAFIQLMTSRIPF